MSRRGSTAKAPAEAFLKGIQRDLRKLPDGSQRAVGGGVYMRLDRDGTRRFTYRGAPGIPGGTCSTWTEAQRGRIRVTERAGLLARDVAALDRYQLRELAIAEYAATVWWPAWSVTVELSTAEDYRRMLLRDLLPLLGTRTMSELDELPLLIDRLQQELSERKRFPAGHKRAGDVPLWACRNVLKVLSAICEDGRQRGVLTVEDGGGASDTWQIGYVNPNLPSPMTAPMMQVSSVTDPGTYNKSDGTTPAIPPTQFSYSGPYTGNVASLATITDPKGNVTKVEMDTEGFPIDIQQPQESIGGTMTTPQTTMVWDTNGNLLCKRSPAANAIALGCTAADPTDPLETDYTYDSLSPHKLVEEQGPKPNPNGTGSRPTWTYNYDEGLTGVLQEDYNSTSFEGMPLNRHISNASTPVSENWGSGQPEGITSPGGWAVRYSGRLHATQSTEKYYHFRVYAQGGVRLVVNHKVIEDCWNTNYSNSTYNCGSNTDGSIELPAGTVVYFDVEYRHFSGSNGVIDVKWDNGAGGSFSSMAPAPLDPGLHLLTSSSNPAGLTTTYTYSAADEVRGQPTSILTSDGTSSRQENFSYDSYGRVTADTHAAGTAAATTVATQYSADHPCASQITDGAGEVSTYQCDAEGDLTQTTKLVPAVSGTQQTHQDQTTTTVYNGDGQPTSVQQTGAPATTTQYYATGQVKTTTDPLGHVAFYTYTPSGQVATETLNYQDPASQQEQLSYHYDADGDQTAVIKEYGGGTNYEWDTGYDAQNRVTSQLMPGVPFATQYAYDQPSTLLSGDHGFLTMSVTAPNGVQTTTTDDLDGNAVDSQVGTQSAHPLNPTSRSYSTAGYVLSTTDPNGITRSATYNGWGDTVTQTEPSGTSGALETTTNAYDAAGNLTSVTNPSQAITEYSYDGDGHIATTTQPNATDSWQFTYDGAGQQIEVTDPDGRVRDWRYNQLGQVAATYEYPQSGTTYETDKSYDGDGELTETTPPTGANLCYTYDDYGNQTSRYTVPNGSTCAGGTQSNSETFTYNPLSGVTTATEGTSGPETTITYDPQNPGRVSQVTESTGSQTTYAYNSQNGQLTSTTDALAGATNTTSYGYDPTSGVVSSVTDPFSGVATTYAYNPGGQVTGRTDPNGLTTTYGYDADGRLGTQTTAPTGGGSALLSFTVGYDKDSRVTSLAQAYPSVGGQANPGTGTWTYTYTTRNELKTSQFGSNPTTTYTYDGANNRQTVTIGTGSPVTWSYDNAGRLTSVGSTTYTWNPENQLTAVGSTRSYSYDPWGRQSQAIVGSQTVNYGYDALSRTLTSAISGGNTTTFTYTGSTQTPFATQVGSQATVYYAQGVGGLLAQQQSGTTRIDYTDPHGDLAMLANIGATPTGTLSYDPFGAQDGTDSGSVGADAQASLLGFQSQPTDPTTGLVDMGARLYDPSQGRFTTQDTQFGTPTDPATLNQYLYAQDSPLVYTDPNGERPACDQCSRSETQEVTDEWVAGYAASQGETTVASQYARQATYWANHPTPPPPARARPIVTLGLPGFHVGWSKGANAEATVGSVAFRYSFEALGSVGDGPLGFTQNSMEISHEWNGLAAELTAGYDGGVEAGLFDNEVHVSKGPYSTYYYTASAGITTAGPTYRVGEESRMGAYAIEYTASLTVSSRGNPPDDGPRTPLPPVIVPIGVGAASRALATIDSEVTPEDVGGGFNFGSSAESYGY